MCAREGAQWQQLSVEAAREMRTCLPGRLLGLAGSIEGLPARGSRGGKRELRKAIELGVARGIARHEAALQRAVDAAKGAQRGVAVGRLAPQVGQEQADLRASGAS